MIEAKENFNNTWPFNPNFFSGNGFKQHYVDEGKENNKVILCLHGEPTWGYIYRPVSYTHLTLPTICSV